MCAVVAIILLGCALRAACPERMAIEHFDEGVYASNLYSGHLDPAYAYPDRALYAPPFLPAVLEWTLLLSGDPHSVMWVNVVVGTLTVLAVWWMTRAWFGPVAALAAAMLAATSEYHIAFSRMALTDVLLCLWMLLGVNAGWKAILSGRPLWIGLAGLLAGLAWCTKYSGWLTLAVTGSGAAAWLMFTRPAGFRWWEVVLRWFGTAVVAGVLFWFVAVRPLGPGEYAAVSANHANYFVGLSGWWSGLMRQLDVHTSISGWVTSMGVAAAVFLAWAFWRPVAVRNGSRWHWLAGGIAALICGTWALGSGPTLLFLLITGIWVVGAALSHGDSTSIADSGNRLAVWMTAAWYWGLLAAVPLYYPYPRLSLPLLVICWPGTAAGMLIFMDRTYSQRCKTEPGEAAARSSAGFNRKIAGLAVAAIVGVFVAGYWQASTYGRPFLPPRFVAWEDRGGVARSTGQILRATQIDLESALPSGDPDLDAVIYVYADPAAFYHLAADAAERAPRVLVHPAGNLGMTAPGATRRPVSGVYLVTGPRAHRDETTIEAVGDRLELIGRYPYPASDLVLLDEFPPEAMQEKPAMRDEELRLYRVLRPE
jgi:4-amino-4-deoxy-L-arabinose transferase-like glycosyltransferase